MIKGRQKLHGQWYVCPKKEGGLGVLHLETHNEALLLKNLHKFYNKVNIPWVQLIWDKYHANGKLSNHTLKGSFWWRDILRLLNKFKSMVNISVHKGDTCFLWQDMWGGSIRNQGFSQLFSFAKVTNISVCRAAAISNINQLFNLPISTEAYQQLLVLAHDLADISLEQEQDDVWTYSWGSTIYMPMKAYKVSIGPRQVHPCFSWLWTTSAQKKHEIFFWLLLKDRLSTRNILRRNTWLFHPMTVWFVNYN
jgi:hypothetical protein